MEIRQVTTEGVKSTLGINTNKVTELCSSDKVNHWARFKPMNMPKAYYNRDLGNDFYKGRGDYDILANHELWGYPLQGQIYWFNACGLRILAFTHPIDLCNMYYKLWSGDEPFNDNYSWDKPKGGRLSPYRLADFLGYDHHCGCQFWSDAVANPWSETLTKYNVQSALPIDCSFTTFSVGGGNNGLSMIDIVESLGGTDPNLCIVNFKENNVLDYEDTDGGEIIDIIKSPIVDEMANVRFLPKGNEEGILSLMYMLEFKVTFFDQEGTPMYIAINQSADKGENTIIKFLDDDYRYGVKRFEIVTYPPTTMQLLQFKTLYNKEWVNLPSPQRKMDSINLYLHFSARAREPFVFNAHCIKFTFTYIDKINSEYKTFEMDGTAIYNTDYSRVRASDIPPTNNQGDNKSITVEGTKDIYVSLPLLLENIPSGVVIPSGSNIIYMAVQWRYGEGAKWENVSTYNINLITP